MRIAAAVDFSERSDETLRIAASLAQLFGGDLLVLHHARLPVLTAPPSVTSRPQPGCSPASR